MNPPNLLIILKFQPNLFRHTLNKNGVHVVFAVFEILHCLDKAFELR